MFLCHTSTSLHNYYLLVPPPFNESIYGPPLSMLKVAVKIIQCHAMLNCPPFMI